MPDRGGEAEVRSLISNASKRIAVPPPPDWVVETVCQHLCSIYPKTKVPNYFKGINMPSRDKISATLDTVKQTSGPGMPWAILGNTKGAVINEWRDLIIDQVLKRLELLCSLYDNPERQKELIDNPRLIIEEGYADPVRTFIKNEPTSKIKIAEGRARIISSVSLVDEIVDKLLFDIQNERELEVSDTIPSKPGTGFSTDEQCREFYEQYAPLKKVLSDMSGWDFSVQPWELQLDCETRLRLAFANLEDNFLKIMEMRYIFIINAVFVTSHGEVYALAEPGIMLSGAVITSSTNSRIRFSAVCFAAMVEKPPTVTTMTVWRKPTEFPWAATMGDDCNEQPNTDLIPKYRILGHRVKAIEEIEPFQPFQFCSKEFSHEQTIPLNWAKSLYNLLCNDEEESLYEQFKHEYRHSPKYDYCMRVLAESGWASANAKKQEEN